MGAGAMKAFRLAMMRVETQSHPTKYIFGMGRIRNFKTLKKTVVARSMGYGPNFFVFPQNVQGRFAVLCCRSKEIRELQESIVQRGEQKYARPQFSRHKPRLFSILRARCCYGLTCLWTVDICRTVIILSREC
jgi:hypothetical protein